MKEEIEYKWLIRLLTCPYAKKVSAFDKLSGNLPSGCLSNFEKYVGVSAKNRDFRIFFRKLLIDGAIKFHTRKITRGGQADFFIVDFYKMKEVISKYEIWKKTMIIAERKDIYGYA